MSEEISPQDVFVAVMGMTGAGKSTFIARRTRDPTCIQSHDLFSCTSRVSIHSTKVMEKTVHLIDVPGFNDSRRSDSETLEEIAFWLVAAHERGIQLSGIVFLHPVTDTRLQGTTMRSLQAFKEICGEGSFAGIVVATTMWDSVPRLEIARAMERHREFSMKACKDIVDKGGRVVALTALQVDEAKILEHIVQKGRRLTLAFQQQLTTQKIPLHETEAGKLLLRMPNSRTDYSAAIIEELRASQPSTGKASEDTVYSVKKGQKALENVIEDVSITLEDIRNAWKENLQQEDLALDQALQHTEALIRASDGNLTYNIQPTAVSTIASSLESMPDYTTASSSASTMDDSSTLQNRSALNTPAISEVLLQRQVLQNARSHRISRRHTLNIISTGLAVGQLVAAIACNVM